MSSEIWQIEKTICRCCHTEGTFHNLAEPRPYLGEMEIYSEMLRECFNIVVTPMPGELCSLTYAICSSCISKLRDASIFKKQVQSSEERFMELYYKNAIHVVNHNSQAIIKEEPDLSIDFKQEYLNISEDENYEMGDDIDRSSDDDMDVPLSTKVKGKGKTKVEKVVKVKSKKQKVKEETDDEKESTTERKKGTTSEEHCHLIEDLNGTVFECKICSRTFKRRDLFNQHYRHVHLKQRPKLRGCHYCKEKVPSQWRARHLEIVHGVPAPSCGACGKKFAYPFQVLKHQKAFHMGEKKFECTHCEMTFASKANLMQHEVKHTKERPFKCDYCKVDFKWKKHLQRHHRIHLDHKRS